MFFKKKEKNEAVNTKVKDRSKEIEKKYDAFHADVGEMSFEKTKAEKQKKRTESENGRKTKKKKESLWTKIKRLLFPGSIPRTAQETIPYKKVYPNGVIELPGNQFTKAYRLTDTNFKDNRQDLQNEQWYAYGDLLNYFTPDVRPQFVIFNRAIEKEKFKEDILFKENDDKYNVLRKDFNNILLSKIQEGQNNITQEKYLVVNVRAENIEIANGIFSRVDGEISQRIKVINEASTDPMTLEERLELLYKIYNQDTERDFNRKGEINGQPAEEFSIEWMQAMGLSTKDQIAPSFMEFHNTYFRVGDKYGCALFMRGLADRLSASVLTDIASVPCTALTSVQYEPCKQDEAIRLVRNQMLEVTRNMSESAKKLAKSGLGAEFISPDQVQEKTDSNKFYADITERNQKTFLMTMTVTVFADDLDDLDKYTTMVQNKADTPHLCKLTKLSSQQEEGFNACLPLAYNNLSVNRLLNSETAALFIPFSSQDLIQAGGLYYGINSGSRNIIMYNRLEGQNANGLIIGQSGSGKSFQAKAEMLQVFLKSEKNEIFVIDPQAEYRPLCEALGGQVVRIAPSSNTHCNPFDLDLSEDARDGDDPVTVKSNYICSICESAIGGHYGLNEVQITIIDRCVRLLYTDYLDHMAKLKAAGSDITCDRDACPTLVDFYQILSRQPEPEAEYLRLAMEKYCVGSFNTFAHKTNIDTNNRFVVYDIRDIGSGMSEMGMQVCLNDIWSRTIQNKKRGVRTWIYIDELYVLTQSESCARFLMYIYKQVRKYGGAPTGITQNVEDLLTNRESRGMINNCSFIMLLNQSQDDRDEIGSMLHISEAQLNYIKNADSGQGLIYSGKSIIPFTNRYQNKQSTLYRTISTNVSDMINYG